MTWFAIAAAALLLYAAFVLALWVGGRRETARAFAGFIPDCLVLMTRLLADPRVPRRYKLLLGFVAVYLASPIDLVPDFIPIAGQLDDAILVAFALRTVLAGAGPALLHQHWPGPPRSLAPLLRLTANRRALERRR